MSLETIIKDLLGAKQVTIVENPGAVPFAIAPDSFSITDIERFAEAPTRIRQSVVIYGAADFCSYVNRFKNEGSTVFVSPSLKSLAAGSIVANAVLDYHDKNAPAHGSHLARLAARPSLGYEKLMKLDGQVMDQGEFARSLEEVLRFAVSHPAADLLEMARTLSLASKGEFRNVEDEISGSVDFLFNMAVTASAGTAGKKITVPTEIVFNVALIEGMQEEPVAVKFLYRTPGEQGGKVQCGIKIIDRAFLEEQALRGVAAYVYQETGIDVFVGELK